VVALRMLDGLGVAEVAHITGNNSNAVRVLSHRGLRQLASELQAASVGGQSPRKGA